jgi:hypothetical protein
LDQPQLPSAQTQRISEDMMLVIQKPKLLPPSHYYRLQQLQQLPCEIKVSMHSNKDEEPWRRRNLDSGICTLEKSVIANSKFLRKA